MKFITYIIVVCFLFPYCLFAQAGQLDSSFGLDGKVISYLGPTWSCIQSMALQPDGKIVVAGNAVFSLLLARYNITGSLDTSFGTNGSIVASANSENVFIHAMALQNDGKIVVSGYGYNQPNNYFLVARFNPNGQADSAFGINGVVFTDFGLPLGFSEGLAIAIQPDGKIVAGGWVINSDGYVCYAMARYNASGTLDNSFGDGGMVVQFIANHSATGTSSSIKALLIQPDGKMLAGGFIWTDSYIGFMLLRFNQDGTPDNTFGRAGMANPIISFSDDGITSLALQPDNKILAGGKVSPYGSEIFALARYDSTGHLDSTFGSNGEVETTFSNLPYDNISSLVLQSDGKIVAVGEAGNAATKFSSGNGYFALARYEDNGILDTTFGTKGTLITDFGFDSCAANSAILQKDGKIIAGGLVIGTYNYNVCPDCPTVAIARYLTTLALGLVNLSTSNNPLMVYPNPVQQNATLEYTLQQKEDVTIRLVNMQGRIIKTFIDNLEQQGTYKQNITLPNELAAGNYLIVLSSPNGKQAVQIMK